MITFFRRIRKGILESGAPRKYLFYAIGEVLLVMIGILLALQVNNWNQSRLNANEEERILQAISQDMERIHNYCRVCGGRQEKVLQASQRLLGVIGESPIKIDTSQLKQDLNDILERCFVGKGMESNIYDVLMSSDQLELLSSRQLRTELGSLDAWIGTMVPYENLQAEFVDSQLKPFVNQYIDRLSISYSRIGLDKSYTSRGFESSFEELLDKKEFSNLLVDQMINTRSITGLYGRVLRNIVRIDSILVEELPSLKAEIINRAE